MASVDDVAAYILKRQGPMDTWKLQKLAYYSQAWHLVWESRPLFRARIEAWANGPVVRALYDKHKGAYRVNSWPDGSPKALDESETTSIDAVLEFYGDKPGYVLSGLTHREEPWLEARKGLAPGERGNNVISWESMASYYSSLI